MSDVAKWAILAAAIAAVISLIIALPFLAYYLEGVGWLNNFTELAGEFLNTVGDVFVFARRLVNNFLPARLVTIVIALSIFRKPLYLVIEAATMIVKAIYK